MKTLNSKSALLASVAMFAGVLPAVGVMPAAAQQVSMEEIVVTVRKRTESLQEVPLSVTAFSQESIEQQQISNLDDLARLTPGFTMGDGFGYLDARPSLRGQSNIRGASQPTLGILIDGIDIPFRSGLNVETLDIARIEVVKGPQSALFGRGVLSGAINYVTQRPSLDKASGYAEVEGATGGLFEVRGRANAPLSPQFGVALAGRYSDFKGFFENNLTGKGTVGGHEFKTVAATALWEPSDTFSAYFRASYSDEFRESPQRHTVNPNTQTGALPTQVWFVGKVPADKNLISHNCDDCKSLEREFTWTSLTLDWDVGFGTISSLTGLTNTDINSDQDSDFAGIPASVPAGPPFFNNLNQIIIRDIETVSQELRFTSPEKERFRWILGAYYYDQKNNEAGQSILGVKPNQIIPPFTFQSDETETYAVFGQAAFDLTEQLTASAEMRWNRDELWSNGTRDGRPFPLNEVFKNYLPRFTLDFDATADTLLYMTVAKGSKPGGFNTALGAGLGTLPLNLIAFDEEKAWNYEVGVKSTLLDGRLIANAAAYYIDWTSVQIDDQFLNPNGTTLGFTSNAGKARVKGFEIGIQALPTDNIDLTLGYSYNPSRVLNVQDSRARAAGIITTGWSNLPFSSDHSVSGAVRVNGQLNSAWTWYVQLDSRFDSTQYATTANLAETGNRFVSNVRIGVEDEKWSIQGYVKNLFDSKTATNVQPFVNAQNARRVFLVTVPDPVQAGIRLRRNF
jgi:iron complex outermembrane receptor protein